MRINHILLQILIIIMHFKLLLFVYFLLFSTAVVIGYCTTVIVSTTKKCMLLYNSQQSATMMYKYSGVKKFLSPFLWFFIFLAYLSHLNDSDHQTNLILHKDNPSKYKMQFWNNDFIY